MVNGLEAKIVQCFGKDCAYCIKADQLQMQTGQSMGCFSAYSGSQFHLNES